MSRETYLALGTPVIFTECAGVARRGGAGMWNKGWHLPQKGNGEVAGYQIEEKDGTWVFDLLGGIRIGEPLPVKFVTGETSTLSDEEVEKFNKAIVTWEREGSGVITGLEAKQYGVSCASSGGANAYGEDDFEPGYFVTHGQLKLYVVRSRLEGRDFVYVPTWAARPMVAAG